MTKKSQKKNIVLPVVMAVIVLGYGNLAQAKPVKSGYAPVNGLQMYYEIHGAGKPLVLLHGGGSTIETSFGRVIDSLAKTRQVIAFEQQGHGHTADIAQRPFTFEQSAEDTAALLKYLHIDQADFFGYSNGGNIALLMGIRHPDMVRKLIVESAMYKRDGLAPGSGTRCSMRPFKACPKSCKRPTSKRHRIRKRCPRSTTSVETGC